MHNIVVFASGNGSNAINLIDHFNSGDFARVQSVFCNNPSAGVIPKAKERSVDVRLFGRNDFYNSDQVIRDVNDYNPDLIVLAGFLWLVPSDFIRAFENRIINLHPALLPAFGGKGMYGRRVHEAVLAAGVKETGISIHLVTEEYDKGEVFFREKFPIEPSDTVERIEQKIHEAEQSTLPKAIEFFLRR